MLFSPFLGRANLARSISTLGFGGVRIGRRLVGHRFLFVALNRAFVDSRERQQFGVANGSQARAGGILRTNCPGLVAFLHDANPSTRYLPYEAAMLVDGLASCVEDHLYHLCSRRLQILKGSPHFR